MIVTGKQRAAIEAMVGLARHYNKGPMNVAEISAASGVSVSYIEQLFAALRQVGLIVGVRGPGGGYILARTPDKISIAEIARAFPPNQESAVVAPLDEAILDFLDDFWLSVLVTNHR